jgi:hypothetical protein
MTATLSAVRIDPDGTVTNVAPPCDVFDRAAWLREQLGGWVDMAHYGTADHAVALVVHETSAVDGQPANCVATILVEELRGEPLGYHLHGPVVLFGYERPGIVSDLRAETRELLASIATLHAAAQTVDAFIPAQRTHRGQS